MTTQPTYATRADVVARAPDGALRQRFTPLQPSAIDTAADTVAVPSNLVFATGHRVRFEAQAGGTLPTGLTAGTSYHVSPVAGSETLIQVSTTQGGAAVNISTQGTAPFGLVREIGPLIDAIAEERSRMVDQICAAHGVPFTAPYPTVVVQLVAADTARQAMGSIGLSDAGLDAICQAAFRDLRSFADRGVPLRDERATATETCATSWGSPAREWGPSDGSLP